MSLDNDYYRIVPNNPFSTVQTSLQLLVKEAQLQGVLNKKESRFIVIQEPSEPFFYYLPKLHKDPCNPPGRPIISGVNSSTSNL